MAASSSSGSNMFLGVGSYERFLFGYTIASPPDIALKQNFSVAAHQGPVRCAAAKGHFLVSGGTDDTIRIFNLRSGKDLGALYQHQGSVSCMKFYGEDSAGLPTHLLSGSDDKTICIWKVGNWAHMQTLSGHKGAVNDVAIHPTGSLGLSVARDGSLRMWDLGCAKLAARVHLKGAEASMVDFTAEGDEYILATDKKVAVHAAEGCEEVIQFKHEKRVLCMAQSKMEDAQILTGTDDGSIYGWDTATGDESFAMKQAHSSRIRGIVSLPSWGDEQSSGHLFASGSSDGVVKVWDARMATTSTSSSPQPLVETNTTARLTCLVVSTWKNHQKKTKAHKSDKSKQKRHLEEEETNKIETAAPHQEESNLPMATGNKRKKQNTSRHLVK